MSEKMTFEQLTSLIDPKKKEDHDWFLSLLDDEQQRIYEEEHMKAVMQMLRIVRIRPHKNAIRQAKSEIERLEREEGGSAETYVKTKALLAEIERQTEKMETYRPFFDEPYFARMDLIDGLFDENTNRIMREDGRYLINTDDFVQKGFSLSEEALNKIYWENFESYVGEKPARVNPKLIIKECKRINTTLKIMSFIDKSTKPDMSVTKDAVAFFNKLK